MRVLLALMALALLVSGCAAPPAMPPPSPAPAQAVQGWSLACLHVANWSDPCTSRATITNGPANENWLSLNPANPQNVFVGTKDFNDAASDCVWGGLMSSKDGGKTWKNSYAGGTKAERMQDPMSPLFGYQCVTDPMSDFDEKGRLYDVVEAYGRGPHMRNAPVAEPDPTGALAQQGVGPQTWAELISPDDGGNEMFVTTSDDGGETFGPMVSVWKGQGIHLVLNDKSSLIVNPRTGSVHFAWSQFGALVGGGAQILAATSRDRGATWDRPVIASDPANEHQQFPAMLSAASDGTLYATWHDWGNSAGQGGNQILFTRSTDDGRTFTPPKVIATTNAFFGSPPNAQFRIVTIPTNAVDRSGGARDGALYVAWPENVSGHMDIRVISSSDGGQTWTKPLLATDDNGSNDQFSPALAVDDRGAVHLTYLDRRYDPGNKLVDLTWAISTDGGMTFPSIRITNRSFDGDVSFHQNGFPFLGDYNGLRVLGGVAYASFPDTSDGRAEIAVAKLVRG